MADTARSRAYQLAEHYLLWRPQHRERTHATFDNPNPHGYSGDESTEVRELVNAIIDAAKAEIAEERGDLDREASARANGMTYP